MSCKSRRKGQVAGREGRRCTPRHREVHTGRVREIKKSSPDLPCADVEPVYVYIPKEGQSLRGQESYDHVGRRGNYRDGELMPRSQGHYLSIRVLSLFSPENKILR